ncbi:hypothetical protein ACFSTD_03585 [Novosphingobium colocasiae]
MTAAEKRKLDMREQAVKASEARLAGQVRQQQEQQAAAAKMAQGSAGPAVPYDNLARIYQTMKPNRAGPIFEKARPRSSARSGDADARTGDGADHGEHVAQRGRGAVDGARRAAGGCCAGREGHGQGSA